ncbi:TadE family type IV pilus minor pilin [Microbacterium lacus]|uniref:TadE-like domain-containing protein n=1 Tax=Microbacterium lacus TaxID=415217 RepID=A0ABN2H1S5_9MICO
MTGRGLGERGSVVAEFAIALPAVVLVLLFGAGAVSASGMSVRLQDAASDAARIVARGEPDARAAQVMQSAVAGSTTGVERVGDVVCVTASAVAPVIALTLTARACALAGGL